MAKDKISKRSVDALVCPPDKERVFLWDTAVTNFGVKAFPNGTKTYIIRFKPNKKWKEHKIGRHGQLAPDQAREAAKALFLDIAKGIDISAARQAAKSRKTLKEVGEEFMQLHMNTKRKESSISGYRQLLNTYVYPKLGEKTLNSIKHADLDSLHASLKDKKNTANKVLQVVSSLWNWAIKRGEVADGTNPAKGIERFKIVGRDRYATQEEYQRLGEALALAESEGLPWDTDPSKPTAKHTPKDPKTVIDQHAVAAIRLLIFTGARVREILHLKWSDVNLTLGLLNLPDSKTGKKVIYLNDQASVILRELPRLEGCPYVIIGGTLDRPRADLKKPWEAIRRVAGLEDFTLHDLRHSFATMGAGASLSLPVIGKLLGHRSLQSTQRYAHLDLDPLQTANREIGNRIDNVLNPKKPEKVNTVDILFED